MEKSSLCNNIELTRSLSSQKNEDILGASSRFRSHQSHHEIIDCENRIDSSNNKKPIQDSEDSSYDSDCEVSDGTTHYDVSRTVSDTLGQEFAEYVTLHSSESFEALKSPGRTTYEFDPGYSSRVEFAKKLGYTETQVRTALSKLGPSPSQNELLSELILLDSSNSSAGLVENEEEDLKSTALPNRSDTASLRHIVIDGSNVAMSHGSNKVFSCRGIQLAVEFFKSRGHKNITVFVPSYRRETSKPDDPVSDKEILAGLEKQGVLVYTPSRIVNNRRLVCYDDRYIIKLAVEVDGIVVSNDNYRDLTLESGDFKRVVEERLLMYSFVNDRFMPPEDPLGRNGPKLDQFLSKAPISSAPPCPYGRKCTYGLKCKYYHVTQQKSVSETLRKQAAMKTQSVPITKSSQGNLSGPKLMPISRTKSAIVPMESGRNEGTQLGANTHKKLQRQLSINPGGDPRISQTWKTGTTGISTGNVSAESSSPFASHRNTSTYLHPFPGNPTLSEVWSPPGLPMQQNKQPASPTSSPESLTVSTSSSSSVYASASGSALGLPQQQQSNRTRMYYHLSAIFPEDQVRHVMSLYPEETDPSFVCRVIVNLFK